MADDWSRGRQVYEQYCRMLSVSNDRAQRIEADAMPKWEELTAEQQDGWEQAAKHADEVFWEQRTKMKLSEPELETR
jgi:hypothetical protein